MENSLSDKIYDKELCLGDDISKIFAKDVKEAVKKDTELIKLFMLGKISYYDLTKGRDSIFGEDLSQTKEL